VKPHCGMPPEPNGKRGPFATALALPCSYRIPVMQLNSDSYPPWKGNREILSSNRGFAEWGEVFGDPVVATALLDRLLHHAVVVQIEGASYRLRAHADLIPEHTRACGRDRKRPPLLPAPVALR
jgi:hypothetical protein